MGTLALAQLAGKRVYLDANVFIYGLDDLPPWNGAARAVLCAVEAGELAAVTSELTLAECLVKPLQTGSQQSVQAYEQSIRPRRCLTLVAVSREVLIEAARVRASSAVRLPDAIHIAVSRLQNCDVFITNDQRLKSQPGLACMLLSEIVMT